MFWLPVLLFASVNAEGLPVNGSRLLKPDDGWVQFQFGQTCDEPFSYFHFEIDPMKKDEEDITKYGSNHTHNCYLEVTDAYCPGDRFQVVRLNTTTSQGNPILLTTPEVKYNNETAKEICDGFPVQCSKFTLNPEVAYNDPTWSSGKVELTKKGNYSIAIAPHLSPYCSGGAFVRLRCVHPPTPHPHPGPKPGPKPHPEPTPGSICKVSEAGLHVVDEEVEGSEAGAVCLRHGMQLARLTNGNFIASTNVAFACSGAQSTTWIGAWNGQTWAGQEGLGLTVATAPGGGSINTFNDGKRRKVLCQEN